MLRVCRAVVGPVDAEDAWSETFLSALRAYPDLPADANVEAWLVTIAHRRALDVGRARSRRPIPTDTLPERPPPRPTRRPATPTCGPPCSDCPTSSARPWPTTTSPACPFAEIADLLGNSPDAARRAAADGIKTLRKHYDEGRNIMSTNIFDDLGPTSPPPWTGCTTACTATPNAAGLLDVAYRTVDTPVGTLLLAATAVGLVRVAFDVEGHDAVLARLADTLSPRILRAPARLDAAARQIDEYFAKQRTVLRRARRPAPGRRVPPHRHRAPARHRLRPAGELRRRSPPRSAVPARCAPSAPPARTTRCRS